MKATRIYSVGRLKSEFDDFLFASIGIGGNGMPVSVLSALARLDRDPWQEAAELAAISEKKAAVRLASMIEALPGISFRQLKAETTAAGLVTLLPRKGRSSHAPKQTMNGVDTITGSRAVIFVTIVALLFGVQTVAFGLRDSAGMSAAQRPVITAFFPQLTRSNLDK